MKVVQTQMNGVFSIDSASLRSREKIFSEDVAKHNFIDF